MPPGPALTFLETDRLLLRHRRVDEAGVFRRLWLERDPRVPAHRKIDAEGRPSVEDIAALIRRERDEPRPGVLAVERRSDGDVLGYCGLVFHGNGAPDEPELAYELLRRAHGSGYATEAGGAVVAWADEAGYQRLWATVRAWNVASRRVLEKLGFHETGQVEVDALHGDSLLTVRSPASTA
jgi:RimJ/RimL family protein N-acetyltransferase